MKYLFLTVFAFSSVSFAKSVSSSDASVLTTVLKKTAVKKELSGSDITNIAIVKSGVVTDVKYEITFSTVEAGLNFPDASTSTHPCSVVVKVEIIGGVVSTEFNLVDVQKICAQNSPKF